MKYTIIGLHDIFNFVLECPVNFRFIYVYVFITKILRNAFFNLIFTPQFKLNGVIHMQFTNTLRISLLLILSHYLGLQVISSSLLALATLLDVLVGMQLERPGLGSIPAQSKHASKARAVAISFAEKLFTAHKCFSDFLKSQSTAVRSATYSVLRSFIKNIPNAFDEANKKTVAGIILGAFQEKDPACHSSMWDAILLFSKRFPDSWTSLNVQKVILNRFWHFLRNGCFGSQQVSYPALVLFLDCVPPKAVVGDKFFLDFFQNLWAGSRSHYSNADRLAFFGAFKECFLWALHNASRYELHSAVSSCLFVGPLLLFRLLAFVLFVLV